MKYIKKFESINDNEPEVGDYAVVKLGIDNISEKPLEKYIGKIIVNMKLCDDSYRIQFFIDDEIKNWWVSKYEIVDFSKNKEDLEYLIDVNKYNL